MGQREVEHSSRLTELIHLGALTEKPDPEKAMNIHPYLTSTDVLVTLRLDGSRAC